MQLCRTCALGAAELRRCNLDLLAGMSLADAASKYGLSPSGVSRHRALHITRGPRRPDPIDEDRSAADVLVGLADTLTDLDRLRNESMAHGRAAVAIRAAAEYRTTARMIFGSLNLDSTSVATWLKDADVLWDGLRRWSRESPAVLSILADHVQTDDPRLARELRQGYDLLVAAKQRTLEKENAA